MRSRQPMRQGVTGMWSTSQASAGRRNGRVDRKRRRSFNMPMVRAKFTSATFEAQAFQPDLMIFPQFNPGSSPRILLSTNRRVEPETSRILRAGKFYNAPEASKYRISHELENCALACASPPAHPCDGPQASLRGGAPRRSPEPPGTIGRNQPLAASPSARGSLPTKRGVPGGQSPSRFHLGRCSGQLGHCPRHPI